MRKIDNIVIHCTATIQDVEVESILNYWENNLGWSSPGYHRIIEADGTIHDLHPFDKPSNGVKGHNFNSIHISYIGGKDGIDNRTPYQKAAILDCIYEALKYKGVNLKSVKILGHRDFQGVKKYCPSFNAIEEYNWITS